MPRTSDRRLIFWPSLTCSCFRRLLFGFRFTLRKWRIAGPGIPESGLPDAVYVTCGPGKLKKLKKRQRQQAVNKRMLAGEWQQRWSFSGLKGGFSEAIRGFPGTPGDRVWLAGTRSHTNARQNEATDNTRLRTCHTKRWRDNQWNLWSQQVQCQCQTQAESQSQALRQNPTQAQVKTIPKAARTDWHVHLQKCP